MLLYCSKQKPINQCTYIEKYYNSVFIIQSFQYLQQRYLYLYTTYDLRVVIIYFLIVSI